MFVLLLTKRMQLCNHAVKHSTSSEAFQALKGLRLFHLCVPFALLMFISNSYPFLFFL